MYADDIKIYAAYDHANPLNIQSKLSEALLKTANWAAAWDLKINRLPCWFDPALDVRLVSVLLTVPHSDMI
ncbi:hypothetical protein OESDEN_00256 [Oesophagostomum dentatum]|uniref:Reverse transcriptase domain-containing protein n=1 Tax=Oesophagostomum dentatum TaxID=61180 RepID=A0A0B1TV63_OESDE|nr:hypothetical protein OESDEN_00256 [Oesophagostomum dentatum]